MNVEKIIRLIKDKKFSIAKSELLTIIEKNDKNNFYEFYLLGTIFGFERENLKAIDNLKQSIKLNNKNKLAHLNIAILYNDINNKNKCIEHLEQALELDENYFEANLAAAKVYDEKMDYNKAEIFYKKSLAINPENEQLNKIFGNYLIKRGNFFEGNKIIYKYSGVIRFLENEFVLKK